MFASEITRAVNIKLRMQQYEEVNVFGLESVVSNDIAENLPWPFQEWRWKKKDVHINIKETSAFGRLCYGLVVHSPKSRFSAGLDSFVSISAIVKGRSASYGLRPAIRRIGSTLIAGCLYPALHFFLTRSNKADHPTRNKDISDPVPNSVLQEKSLEEVVSLAKIPGLKRFAANWVRLTVLLLGKLPPWFGSQDSWRFQHYACSAYPISWQSPAARKVPHDQFDFDASLGFPGEGPAGSALLWILPIILAFSWSSHPGFLLAVFAACPGVLPVVPVVCLFVCLVTVSLCLFVVLL